MIPTSNHNFRVAHSEKWVVVYLLIPTSNHNKPNDKDENSLVVYLLIPTSNHNREVSILTSYKLYIFWFLHQTTTSSPLQRWMMRCISFDSYIKPQLLPMLINHVIVVYLLIPTSNHNSDILITNVFMLYIFWFLHQTTTLQCYSVAACKLYIFWFLHQTTTTCQWNRPERCCISFDSYIKPQLILRPSMLDTVVYLLIPTSNHNDELKEKTE